MFKSKSPAPAEAPVIKVPAAPAQVTYSNCGGHEIVPTDRQPIIIYSTSETDSISVGQIVTSSDGGSYLIVELRHVSGRLYRFALLPVAS